MLRRYNSPSMLVTAADGLGHDTGTAAVESTCMVCTTLYRDQRNRGLTADSRRMRALQVSNALMAA